MCEPSPTPLARLNQECARCLRQAAGTECEACRALAFRALCDGNDAAWDLLAAHLWPFLLRWLYAAQPEVPPARAEAVGYRALWGFRHACMARADLATNFPAFPALLALLHRCLREALARSIE